jgi:DUF3006 family protein
MECIIDRFEGDYVVIEYNNKTFNFPKDFIPSEAKEGDVIDINVSINIEETNTIKKEVEELMDDVWEE